MNSLFYAIQSHLDHIEENNESLENYLLDVDDEDGECTFFSGSLSVRVKIEDFTVKGIIKTIETERYHLKQGAITNANSNPLKDSYNKRLVALEHLDKVLEPFIDRKNRIGNLLKEI